MNMMIIIMNATTAGNYCCGDWAVCGPHMLWCYALSDVLYGAMWCYVVICPPWALAELEPGLFLSSTLYHVKYYSTLLH